MRAPSRACRDAGVVLAVGYQRRREAPFRWMRRQIDAGAMGRLVNAEANISRDRLGKVDLGPWRYAAEGMPGGVMLQIGIHYTDVLAYLLGPVRSVSASLAQLVLPGDNPDVASLVLEHESGALATLNASYASAAEHYVLNLYGKEAGRGPVEITVLFPAGSSADVTARLLAEGMARHLAVPVLVVHRAGAGHRRVGAGLARHRRARWWPRWKRRSAGRWRAPNLPRPARPGASARPSCRRPSSAN
jgi:hypothetical protein